MLGCAGLAWNGLAWAGLDSAESLGWSLLVWTGGWAGLTRWIPDWPGWSDLACLHAWLAAWPYVVKYLDIYNPVSYTHLTLPTKA